MKLLITIFIFIISFYSFSQVSPNIVVKDNPAYGSSLKITDLDDERGYNTINYQLFKKKKNEIKLLEEKRKTIIKEVENENDQDKIKNLYNEERKIKAQLSELNIIKDSLYNVYIKEYLNHNNVTFGFGVYRSRALFEMLYKDDNNKRYNLFNSTGVNLGSTTGSIYSELVSGHMYLVRASIGVMVASSASNDSIASSEDEAYQRLVTYGGNTVLTLEHPLLYAHTNNNQSVLIGRIIGKFTADFPEFGTTTEDWAGSASIGLDLYGDISTRNKKIRFFGMFAMSQYIGTDTFKNNLNIEDKNFHFAQGKLGVSFNNISLSFIVVTLSSENNLRNKNVIAGGQVLH